MSDARDVQQVLARLKDAVHSNNKRLIARGAGDKEIALDGREGPPSGYTPLFPPAEVVDDAQNVNRRICYFLFVICYFISSLTRADLCDYQAKDSAGKLKKSHHKNPVGAPLDYL
jgi:hypothetical protein